MTSGSNIIGRKTQPPIRAEVHLVIARAVEFADIPRSFGANAIDRAHEIAIRNGVRRLLDLPQILREARDCC